MTDSERLAREGRLGFHIALAGVLALCFAPLLSWGAALRQPASDPTGWRGRLVLLAVLDTLLVVVMLAGGARTFAEHATSGARIGVALDPSSTAESGTIVDVARGSPAEAAGLRAGDRIVAVDGKAAGDNAQLTKEIGATPAGTTRHLEVRRGSEDLDMVVVPVTGIESAGRPPPLFARAPGMGSKWTLGRILDQAKGFLATLGVLAILAALGARRKVGLRPIAIAMAAMAAPALVTFAVSFALQKTIGISLGAALVAMLAGALTMLGVAAAGVRGGGPGEMGTLRAAGLGLFYAFAGGIRAGLFAGLASSLLHLPNHPAIEVFGVSPAWGAGGVLLFSFTAGVVAPVAEECVFRGVLLPWLAKWMRPAAAVVVSAIAFGVGHLFYGTSVLVPFAYGLALGWARVRTGRLRASILVHVAVNVFATSLMLATRMR